MNLLTKLGEKFKNVKEDTKKRIMATILAGGIALSGVGMAGCNNTADPNNTNPPIVNPGDNNGGSQNGGTQNGGTQNPDYSKYSQILQNVMNDNHYNSLIFSAESSSNPKYAYNFAPFQPIPLGFIEDQGFDVQKYQYGTLASKSELFSIGNDLYVELKLEIPASTNYMANYVLKYSLTDQEIKEMNKLFNPMGSSNERKTYYQASFFVQELSYLKTPEIKSVAYDTPACNNSVIGYFNKEKFMAGNHLATYLGSEPVENSQDIFHNYIIRPNFVPCKTSTQVASIKIFTRGHKSFYDGNKFVLNTTSLESSGKITAEDYNKFEENIQTATAYSTNDHYFVNIKSGEHFEFIFGN